MAQELISASLAVVLTAMMPGYFWSKALLATKDHAERLTYSIALSLTLVPATALALQTLFGTGGITFVVSAAAVAVVFLSGLGLFLWFGPGKDQSALSTRPARLSSITILPLLAAFTLLIMASVFEVFPIKRVMLPVLLLVLLGGVLHLISRAWWETGRASRVEDEDPGEDLPLLAATRYILLAAVIALVLLRGYSGPVIHDWPFIRGDDQYEHTVMTNMMITQGTNESFMLYPPGFHTMMAVISHFSNLGPLDIFAALAPALFVLPTLSCYSLARRLWGWEAGVAAAFFSGALLGGTYFYFEHARYPNLIAGQFLFVLSLAVLFWVYSSPSWRGGLLLALLGSSVVLYHMVASLYLAMLLALISLFILPYLLIKDRARGITLFLSFALLGALSVIYAWDTYDLPGLVGGLLGGSHMGKGGSAIANALGTKPVPTLSDLINMTSQPVLWLGVFGWVLLVVEWLRSRRGRPDALARGVLIVWPAIMLACSRTSYSAFPDRFELDLGVMLAVLAALAMVTIVRSVLRHTHPVGISASSLALLLAGIVIGLGTVQSLKMASGPSSQLTITPETARAGKWLSKHNTGGSILATPYLQSLPSRGMLAMGHYTKMQSYTAGRIAWGRDLPPFGAQPLKDALWILNHPGGEHTANLIDKYDVRYIIFDKQYPGIIWLAYLKYPNLYNKVYNSQHIVIFATTRQK